MSSAAESMLMNLFEEQDMSSKLGILPNFLTNFASDLPILMGCAYEPLKTPTIINPSSLAADHHLPDLISNLSDINHSFSTNQKEPAFSTPHSLAESQILSLAKSSPNNHWAWGELNDGMNLRRSTGGDDIDHQYLRVSAMKMKKIYKTRRRMREPRFCFKTMSDVDVLDDGYKWRKYGQKTVKDTLHPRSYYRCTQDNCGVKKRVERLAEDPRMVITTYEGRHIHSPSHNHEDDDHYDSSQSPLQLNSFFW